MKDALKFPVASSVKCLKVIYANLHFLPTKILSYRICILSVWKEFHFPVKLLQTCFVCLLKHAANQDCIHSVRATLMKNVKSLYSEEFTISFFTDNVILSP